MLISLHTLLVKHKFFNSGDIYRRKRWLNASASSNDHMRYTRRMLTFGCNLFVKRVHLCPLINVAYLSDRWVSKDLDLNYFSQLYWWFGNDSLKNIKLGDFHQIF